ncbi:hypothetical protein GPECTOR_55g280 [Gonium pectorale]|uniref:Uncharacterized protein n=1 Tax=Gonium pectorale TaxID=33097 RepID=A0A150G6C5_GONPE|nr:hypothetical protein GPECTOR_55g280 [Gonium pectorale]|eukprot:KXZ45374.1 hypothetical protein GPECTOR_55g280 [Gonium pectorale]
MSAAIPAHTTFRLSRPVPPTAFAAHWLAPGAARGLTQNRRWQLLCLTAASGVVANLEVAVQAAGCLLTCKVFEAAASAGKLEPCQWLWQQACPTYPKGAGKSDLLAAAARGGHRHVCEWLLTLGLAWSSGGAAEAARAGYVGLMEWLQQEEALAAAAGSPTPDWAAKVEWLEAQGCPRRAPGIAAEAAALPHADADADAVARLAWLHGRGYALDRQAVAAAAEAGNAAAVQFLLTEAGVKPPPPPDRLAAVPATGAAAAAAAGHLPVLVALHAAGWPLDPAFSSRAAAGCGQLHVVAWLVETLGEQAAGVGCLLSFRAAESGSVELLAWLRDRGCDCSTAFSGFVSSGCWEAVEWALAQGFFDTVQGYPYIHACRNGDLATARLLRRMGVPWGPAGKVAFDAARNAPLPMLR